MPVPCLLCGALCDERPLFSMTDKLAMTTRRYDVVRCGACRSLRVTPLPTDEELGRLYPVGYNFMLDAADRGTSRLLKTLEWRLFYRPILRRSFRLARRAVGRTGFSVLDIGCGNGQRLEVFKEAGCAVEGNETAPACVAYIRKRGGIPVHEGRIEGLLPGRTYDLVTMFALLEHLTDPGAVVDAARRLLNPGGILIMQVPVVDSLQFRMLGKRAAMMHDVPRHVFIPSIAGLRGFMRARGFDITALYPVSVFERATLCALGLLPSAATPAAYRRGAAAAAGYRFLGWLLTLFPGLPVALLESLAGTGAEMVFVCRLREENSHEHS